jgi:photosystem II stability/assembly factor-like uncharacterized protein
MKLSARTAGRGKARAAAAVTAIAAAVTLAACNPAAGPARSGSPSGSQPAAAASGPTSGAPAAAPTTPAAGSAGTPAGPAAGFRVLSMSFVSDQRGFALGTAPCGRERCPALLGTTDGGRTWTRLAAPDATAPAPDGSCPAEEVPCVDQVRFGTPLIGYAYDTALYVTTDGGRQWQLRIGNISSLEAAGGTVVRVASDYLGCGGSQVEIDVARAGSGTWVPLPAPDLVAICPPVLYRQGQLLVLAAYGNPAGGVPASAAISRSDNGGRTWTAAAPDSCASHQGDGRDGYASAVALAPPAVLVLLCQHQAPAADGSHDPAWVRVSTNGGASYGPDQAVPLLPHQLGGVPSYQIAAASAGRILVVEGTNRDGAPGSNILLTVNGGLSWFTTGHLTASAPDVLVGFEDPLTARVAQGDTVWTTRDGGRTWLSDHF